MEGDPICPLLLWRDLARDLHFENLAKQSLYLQTSTEAP